MVLVGFRGCRGYCRDGSVFQNRHGAGDRRSAPNIFGEDKMNEKYLEWLERQVGMKDWSKEDEAVYNDLKYYLSTSRPTTEETDRGTEFMRLSGKPWVELTDSQKIELLRTCVRLLALFTSSGAEYFLQQVVEKLSPEGK
jgi:hypothetical protein